MVGKNKGKGSSMARRANAASCNYFGPQSFNDLIEVAIDLFALRPVYSRYSSGFCNSVARYAGSIVIGGA
jgi:hypothetical protein